MRTSPESLTMRGCRGMGRYEKRETTTGLDSISGIRSWEVRDRKTGKEAEGCAWSYQPKRVAQDRAWKKLEKKLGRR